MDVLSDCSIWLPYLKKKGGGGSHCTLPVTVEEGRVLLSSVWLDFNLPVFWRDLEYRIGSTSCTFYYSHAMVCCLYRRLRLVL